MTFFNCFRSTMDSPSNDTWLNIIEEPSVLNHWNCSKYQILAITYGDPCLASMSCVGLVFNLLVIIVISKSMGMNDRRTQAQIHLTSLAFSDIAVLVGANSLAIPGLGKIFGFLRAKFLQLYLPARNTYDFCVNFPLY